MSLADARLGRIRLVDVIVVATLTCGAAFARLYRIGDQTAFVDEITWLEEGRVVVRRLAAEPLAPPRAWGKTLRHPGVPLALVAGSFGRAEATDRVVRNETALERARAANALAGVLTVVLLYVLGLRTIGRGPAACAALLLAASPFHIAMSAWLECDALLTLFTTLTLLAFACYLRERRAAWLAMAAVAAAEAVVAKLPGLLLGPALLAALLAYPERPTATFGRRLVEPLRPRHLAALIVFGVAVWASWPRVWLEPREILRVLRWAGELGEHHLNWFWGAPTQKPPWWYYLAVVPLRLSELEIGAILGALVLTIRAGLRGQRPSSTAVLFALFAVIFVAGMSLGGKKLGARYVLAIWPAGCVCVSTWIHRTVRAASTLAGPRAGLFVGPSAVGLLAAMSIWTLAPTFPARFAAYDRSLGGIEAAARIELIHGVGEREVARRLDLLPASASVGVVGHWRTVAFHSHRRILGLTPSEGRRQARAGTIDYLAVFLSSERRSDIGRRTAELGERIWSLEVSGVTVAKLYRCGHQGAREPTAPRAVMTSLRYDGSDEAHADSPRRANTRSPPAARLRRAQANRRGRARDPG